MGPTEQRQGTRLRIRSSTVLMAALLLVNLPSAANSSPVPAAGQEQQSQQRDPETRLRNEIRESEQDDEQASAPAPQQPSFAPSNYPARAFSPPARRSGQKLDTSLAGLANIRTSRGDSVAALFASQRGLRWRDGDVFVRVDAGLAIAGRTLAAASSRLIVDEVLADLNQAGAHVRHVFGPHIEAWVPVEELFALELRPSVRGIHRPWKMRSAATSEGVEVIGADRWDGVRFRDPTGGLRVGVIDLSFKGWENLRGVDLPPEDRLMTRSFRDDGELEIDDEHGTAVAEIIYDIEQGMTLYLAAVETFGEIDEAITYMIDNGVDVINMSLGCVGCAPGNGEGVAIEIVERAPQAGIPFVTSAGNEARKHWIGGFVDSDGDGLHEFAPGDESNSFDAVQGDEIVVVMNWDFPNWFASTQDYDLLLLDSQDNIVDQSRNRQAGFPGQEAVEEIVITLPFTDTFHVVVQDIQTSGPQVFEIFLNQDGLEHLVAEQSITVPADGRQVVAVGAAHWSNDVPQAFSSRGPTKDGRMKPDMAGPDGVSTVSFGPLGFFGTSAAAPHVVGAVALLRGRLGLVTGTDAFQLLMPRLVDLPPAGADNTSGHGRVSLIPPF